MRLGDWMTKDWRNETGEASVFQSQLPRSSWLYLFISKSSTSHNATSLNQPVSARSVNQTDSRMKIAMYFEVAVENFTIKKWNTIYF